MLLIFNRLSDYRLSADFQNIMDEIHYFGEF